MMGGEIIRIEVPDVTLLGHPEVTTPRERGGMEVSGPVYYAAVHPGHDLGGPGLAN